MKMVDIRTRMLLAALLPVTLVAILLAGEKATSGTLARKEASKIFWMLLLLYNCGSATANNKSASSRTLLRLEKSNSSCPTVASMRSRPLAWASVFKAGAWVCDSAPHNTPMRRAAGKARRINSS